MQKTLRLLVALLGLGAVSLSTAQPVRVTGPVLGFVFDSEAAGLRPILGIPGAAVVGAPVNLGVPLSRAAVSPRSDFVLALAGPAQQVAVFRNLAEEPSAELIPGVAPAADQILLSPTGSAAALVYRSRNVVQLVSGLPEAPAARAEIGLSGLPSPLTVWAVSDDGASLIVSTPAAEAESVFCLGADGNLQLLLTAARAAAITFLNRRPDAVVADSVRSAVYWVRDLSGAGEVITLATERDGIADPVAVSLSTDNRRVFVANAAAQSIVALDLTSGAAALIPCDCTPSGLQQLHGNAVFRLTDLSGEPVWVYDGDGHGDRVVFVPVDRAGEAQPAAEGGRR